MQFAASFPDFAALNPGYGLIRASIRFPPTPLQSGEANLVLR
jgi:hypothetical protein